jgi:hypothetical protein
MNRRLFTLLCLIAFGAAASFGQARTEPEGGVVLTMTHSVVAGGGGYSQWTQPDVQGTVSATVPNFEVEGTIGQAIAGTASTGGQYRVHQGFWFPEELQPTAAAASITGQVLGLAPASASGRRVHIELTNLETGEVRTAILNQFGFYVFDDLEVSVLYQLRAVGPSMVFEPDSFTVRLVDNMTGVDFSAMPAQ